MGVDRNFLTVRFVLFELNQEYQAKLEQLNKDTRQHRLVVQQFEIDVYTLFFRHHQVPG